MSLKVVGAAVHPNEILLVVDAMTGQGCGQRRERLRRGAGIDGVVLTKLDGDCAGGAALDPPRTGKPIKFAGTGEKLDMIEQFHPDRMLIASSAHWAICPPSSRRLSSSTDEAGQKARGKARKNRLTLSDYLDQLE